MKNFTASLGGIYRIIIGLFVVILMSAWAMFMLRVNECNIAMVVLYLLSVTTFDEREYYKNVMYDACLFIGIFAAMAFLFLTTFNGLYSYIIVVSLWVFVLYPFVLPVLLRLSGYELKNDKKNIKYAAIMVVYAVVAYFMGFLIKTIINIIKFFV